MYRIKLSPLKISILYTIILGIWIFISDNLIVIKTDEINKITAIQTIKSWFSIILSASILYWILVKYTRQLEISRNRVKKSETKLKGIFDSDLAGILFTDKDWNVIEANNFFLQLTEKQNYHFNLKSLTLPIYQEQDKQINQELFAIGKSTIRERMIKSESGASISILMGAVYLPEYEKNVFILIDISQQKKYKDQLNITNVELNTFLYKTSHDLKGPLSSVSGLAQIALVESQDENVKKYLDLILQSTKRLDQTLYNLIDIISVKEPLINPITTDVRALLNDTWQVLLNQNNIAPESIEFKININLQCNLYIDAELLKMIFKNLLDNCIKYKNHFADKPMVQVNAKLEKGKLLLEIADNGLGIDPKFSEKIFDMFYRGSMYSKGSGLGLYIVKQSIIKLKGEITYFSRRGGGTIFKIRIPMQSQKRQTALASTI